MSDSAVPPWSTKLYSLKLWLSNGLGVCQVDMFTFPWTLKNEFRSPFFLFCMINKCMICLAVLSFIGQIMTKSHSGTFLISEPEICKSHPITQQQQEAGELWQQSHPFLQIQEKAFSSLICFCHIWSIPEGGGGLSTMYLIRYHWEEGAVFSGVCISGASGGVM